MIDRAGHDITRSQLSPLIEVRHKAMTIRQQQSTALAANGVPIEGSPWTFTFTDLPGGVSQSWITLFTINLGARTTIAWTATAIPDCADCDLNMGNNTVTATSNVRVTGSGGR